MNPFWYILEQHRIAERPVVPYHDARMLVVNRENGEIQDAVFSDLPCYLTPSFHVVLNNTKVLKARLLGKLQSGSDAEIMLVKRISESTWEVLGKPMRKFKTGVKIFFDAGLECRILTKDTDEYARVEFTAGNRSVSDVLEEVGNMPIPPYIRKGKGDSRDILDYQTCFAQNPGSIAAPTASLHITGAVLAELNKKTIGLSYLTLHLGPASFKPVLESSDSELKPPGKERLVYEPGFAGNIHALKNSGKKILAVGTSVTRALESVAKNSPESGSDTDLFITPGFQFSLTDALITNFHQPGTTHLLLVEAFLGRELLEKTYEHALKNNYRFLSYGDGMLIL